jgi:hypothetical protein
MPSYFRFTSQSSKKPETIAEYLKLGAVYSERLENKEWVHWKHIDRASWELGYDVVKAFELEKFEDFIVQRAAEAQGLTALPFMEFLTSVLEPLGATVNGSDHEAEEYESQYPDYH